MKNHTHTHQNEQGVLVKCYHKCRSILSDPAFWIGVTLTYPLEHWLWTKVPVFSHISHFLGLLEH